MDRYPLMSPNHGTLKLKSSHGDVSEVTESNKFSKHKEVTLKESDTQVQFLKTKRINAFMKTKNMEPD